MVSYVTPGPLSGLRVSASGLGRGRPIGRFSPLCWMTTLPSAALPRCRRPLVRMTAPEFSKVGRLPDEPVYQYREPSFGRITL